MQVQFFPHRADEFRPTHSNHPEPKDGSSFGVLDLTTWDTGGPGFLGAGKVRDSLSVYFDDTADLDRLIEAAQALRDDMAAGREALMVRQPKPLGVVTASTSAADPPGQQIEWVKGPVGRIEVDPHTGEAEAHPPDGDHTGGGPVG